MSALTNEDRKMIGVAMNRGQVIVQHEERTMLVTLMAWRPKHHGRRTKRARVQIRPGKFVSVPIENVRMP